MVRGADLTMAERVLAVERLSKRYGDVVALAVLPTPGGVYGMVRLAARIYAPALVRGGARLSWREALRLGDEMRCRGKRIRDNTDDTASCIALSGLRKDCARPTLSPVRGHTDRTRRKGTALRPCGSCSGCR